MNKETHTLQLKDIAPLIPFKLKCYAQGMHVDDYAEPKIPTEYTITGVDLDSDGDTFVHCNDGELHYEFIISEVFPLMHPLNSLTKEIEVNGERFVPIERILEGYGCIQCEATTDEQRIHIYDVDEDKVIDIIDSENIRLSSYQIVNNLFKWHFDVFGLIGKGLAIDLNTINNG